MAINQAGEIIDDKVMAGPAIEDEIIVHPRSAGVAAGKMTATNLDCAGIIKLPIISNPKGNLTFIESNRHIPFEVRRVYYLYDVPGGEARGGHAHKMLNQFIIAVSGSFEVILDDGYERSHFFLNRSYYGLYVPQMLWREIQNFSSGSVCLVLASDLYDESDYYRDYHEFLQAVRG